MGLLIVYFVIWSILGLIAFTLVFVFARRFHMQRRYRLLDLERERYAGLPSTLLSGASTDTGALRKPPGSNAWVAIEEALFNALDSGKETGRVRGLFDGLGYTEYYMKKLKRGNRWERALYAERLGKLECVEAVPELINALSSEYRDVRMLAAHSLGRIRDERGLPPLIMELRTAIVSDDEDMSLKILKSAIISFGPVLMERIPPLTKDPEWRIRAAAIEVLGEVTDQAMAPIFMEGLTDPGQDVRAKSARALGKLGRRQAVPELTNLLKDPFWVVRIHASRALGLIGDHCAIPGLIGLLTDMDWQVRKSAAEALGRLGGDAYPALLGFYLDTEDNYGRAQAAEELEAAGVISGLMDFLLDRENGAGRRGAHAAELERHAFPGLKEVLRLAGEERAVNGLIDLAGKAFSNDEIMAAASAIGNYGSGGVV